MERLMFKLSVDDALRPLVFIIYLTSNTSIWAGAPHAETLLILFDLLDYGCWQSVLEPWNLLANQLTSREKQWENLVRLVEILYIYKRTCFPSRQFRYFTRLYVYFLRVDRKCVTNCWSVRQSWWPSFHFTPHKLSMDENVEGLIEAKIRVASVLIGDGKICLLMRVCCCPRPIVI